MMGEKVTVATVAMNVAFDKKANLKNTWNTSMQRPKKVLS